ncbi:MAG: uracil-DNA glycosylase family protein [Clostridia bacterium]|jgi:uracil-DNA glycosylase family 4
MTRFVSLNEFLEEIQSCHKCFMAGDNHPILDSLDRNIQYMMIYEMPSSIQSSNRIIPGPVRQLLDDAFTVSGFLRDNFYITNIVKCNLDNSSFRRGTCIQYCLPYIRNEIEILQPTCIFPLGKNVFTLLCKSSIPYGETIIGRRFHYMGLPLYPLPHPRDCLICPESLYAFQDSLRNIRNAIMEDSYG